MKINIITDDNGVGLSRDLNILKDIFINLGHSVNYIPFYSRRPIINRRYVNARVAKSDLNIFLEVIDARFFNLAKKNWLIPNPEWFFTGWTKFLPHVDLILTKTKHATSIFQKYRRPIEFISFTSRDVYLPGINKNDNLFFHLAGKSIQKGTENIIRIWENDSSLPKLFIIQDISKRKVRKQCDNITYRYDRLSDNELFKKMNECGVHICTSETEGFGHYIMEALSCGSIVITTDAPPMNEFVDEDFGFLIKHNKISQKNLATNYYFDPNYLSGIVRSIANLNEEKRNTMHNAAKCFFKNNNEFFLHNFKCLIEKI